MTIRNQATVTINKMLEKAKSLVQVLARLGINVVRLANFIQKWAVELALSEVARMANHVPLSAWHILQEIKICLVLA